MIRCKQSDTLARTRERIATDFIAQDLEAACSDPFFAHIVGSTPATDDEGEEIGAPAIKTVDYSRLVAILWTTVRDLRNRVQELENAQP